MSDEAPRGAWRIASSAYAIDTPYLRLRRDVVELPNGARIEDYYVRETRGFVVVAAIRPDGDVVLVRQYKHGIGEEILELPAGAIEPGEAPEICAARELAEETGYVGAAPEPLGRFVADPTNSNGRLWLYLIRDAEPKLAPSPDPTEEITVEHAAPATLRRYVRDGTIAASAHVCAIYVLLEHLGLLAER